MNPTTRTFIRRYAAQDADWLAEQESIADAHQEALEARRAALRAENPALGAWLDRPRRLHY